MDDAAERTRRNRTERVLGPRALSDREETLRAIRDVRLRAELLGQRPAPARSQAPARRTVPLRVTAPLRVAAPLSFQLFPPLSAAARAVSARVRAALSVSSESRRNWLLAAAILCGAAAFMALRLSAEAPSAGSELEAAPVATGVHAAFAAAPRPLPEPIAAPELVAAEPIAAPEPVVRELAVIPLGPAAPVAAPAAHGEKRSASRGRHAARRSEPVTVRSTHGRPANQRPANERPATTWWW